MENKNRNPKKKKFCILCGESGSGKNYVLNYLVNNCGYVNIVSYTTRPMRDGEVDGVDYNFISDTEFNKLIENDYFVEYRKYDTLLMGHPNTWYYGVGKQDYSDDLHYIVILDLEGAKNFQNYYGKENCETILLYCDDDVRMFRAKKRGSFDEVEWGRRLFDDREKFNSKNQIGIVDRIIDNSGNNIENVICGIIK